MEYLKDAKAIEAEKRSKKRYRAVEGHPFWPHEVVRDSAMLFFFMGIIMVLCALTPYYLEAPANPAGQPEVILPDWYLLWSYGLLKPGVAIPITFGDVELVSGKLMGILLNMVFVGVLAVIPFIDRGKSKRPVESPFQAAFGIAGLVFTFMITLYSINGVVYVEYSKPIYPGIPTYGTDILVPEVSLLAWLVWTLPVVFFAITYMGLKKVQRLGGYEFNLNRTYYKVR
jgi:quinol-cytochrome oxidoreductase complex cytochrome b subunit